jgi:hypothetical protein
VVYPEVRTVYLGKDASLGVRRAVWDIRRNLGRDDTIPDRDCARKSEARQRR